MFPVKFFLFVGSHHSKRAMRSFGIVEALNVSKYRYLQFLQRMAGPAVDFLLFEVLEEAFTTGIIVRILLL